MPWGTCTVDGCERTETLIRGLCNPHYLRLRRHGDPTVLIREARQGMDEVERFWQDVSKGPECWTWTGRPTASGYGRFTLKARAGFPTREEYAHRYSYRLNVGHLPDEMKVCHHCDNPICVRPDHLFLGTQADNIRDMDKKGRRVNAPHFGTTNPAAKMTPETVRELRRRVEAGDRTTYLAREYGIHFSTLRDIINRRTWRHVA